MPLLPESEYGAWEEHTGEDGQKYWLFKDIYGREWDISPNFRVVHVYPDDPPNYNEIDYEDVRGNFFQEWDDENGHHSEYWDPEKEWYYPYGPGTDYPDVEPMDITSQPQEQPEAWDEIEQDNPAKDHLPPPWIEGEEDHTGGRLPLPDPGIEGEEDHTGGRLPLPDDTAIQAQDNLAKGHLPGLVEEEPSTEQSPPAEPPVQPTPPPPDHGLQENYAKDYGFPGLGVEPPHSLTPEDLAKQQAEERARAEEAQNPTPPADPPPTPPQGEPPVDPNADRQPPEEPPPSPTPEDLGLQEHYGKDHNIPDLVEESAPAPRIQGEENLAKGHLPGLVEEEPPVGQQPPAEPPVQPNPPAEPPVEQSPTPNPPAVPGGEGGIPGMGVPYQDFIPFYPMVQDPITGQWRNAQPGEIPGVEEGDEAQLPPGSQTPESEPPLQPTPPGDDGGGIGVPYQDYIPFWPMVQDPTTGEWRNAEPEELDGLQSGDPNTPGSPQMLSNLLDPSAPGPTLHADLFNPSASGPTLDPRLLLDPDSPGPNIDPALLDPLAPGPTIDPAVLDPNEPGPTVDPSLLDPSAPGETIDPALLDPGAPGPTLDPAHLEQQGIAEPSGGGVMEPASVTDQHGFTDPSLTESGHPEPTTPGHDFDDPSALG